VLAVSGSCHTKEVPEFCTCGAQLPPDARFCHKCAKPQYDDPAFHQEIEAAAPLPPPLLPVVPSVPNIDFHNRIAVRAGFVAAVLGVALSMVPLPLAPVRLLVGFLAAGVLAAYLYRRRTGQALSVRSGARIGWITGIFAFTITMVLSTLGTLAASSQGKLAEVLRSQALDPSQAEVINQALREPATLVVVILISLVMLFILLTALPILGGALCAKLLEKE
jgi:hypothetical protein